MENINFIVITAEVILGVALAIVYIRSQLPKQTIKQQGELITALQQRQEEQLKENKELRDAHAQSERAIADLQGQIKVYKELPLKEIAESLQILERMPEQFNNMQKENTKAILGAFTNIQQQNVKHQTVEHEHIKNKEK
jgi:hypothetical protein